VETESALLRRYVETNDSNLVVEDVTVRYRPKRSSFWPRHWLKVGVGAGLITYVLLRD